MRWQLESGTVAAVRFGISPLFELAALVRRLQRNARGGIAADAWDRWRASFSELTAESDVRLLLGLSDGRTGPMLWVPGTPTLDRTFADDLRDLEELPDELVRADLQRLGVRTERPGDLDHLRDRIESAVTMLWQQILEPDWTSIRSVDRHEISRMSNILQGRGWEGVFDSIADGVSWDGEALELSDFAEPDADAVRQPTMIMMPSAFIQSGPVVWSRPSQTAVIVFLARGVGTLFSTSDAPSDPLAALVGSNRARILRTLEAPTSVTALRDLLGLSLGSLSRQLSVLVDSGLASSRRVGRVVEYELTNTGRAVISGQSGADA